MSAVISSLINDQRKKLLSLFNHAQLHLLYKASVHGFHAIHFHNRCDRQGPTICVAYNSSGFVFGAYTAKDFAQTNQNIIDEQAFLYSISEERPWPLRVGVTAAQPAFVDGAAGPNFGALLFLLNNTANIQSAPGAAYNFNPAEMHGGNLALTEFEVYRIWEDSCKRQLLKEQIQLYHPDMEGVKEARVLMVGPVGAGKSSFFNSINSVFRGGMTSRAIAGTAGKIPLVLCDTMGLEESPDAGLDPDDVISICKGHVQDRYQFSQAVPLQKGTPGYKKHATLKDQIHCVVYVVDASKVSLMSQKILDKFGSIRKKANQMGVPQILLLTKIDEACPLVQEDLKNVYHSVYIHKKVCSQEVSENIGIPLSCIIPVKNYSEELELEPEVDVLLLSAVEQMLNYADSFFENLDFLQKVELGLNGRIVFSVLLLLIII
uniref:TLDc domain-containing protein n=1 Tax=Neogobius melanostomus TaxID=47308 RepID=A0A8C6UW21_9GOBI